MYAVYEVVVHFDSFRNVDLFHQGLYHIKARIHYTDKSTGERRPLTPVGHHTDQLGMPPQKSEVKSVRSDHHCLVPPHIIEDTFSTRSFLIRYCEEEVEMNDIVQFRLEIDASIETLPELQLDVDLMFADLSQQVTDTKQAGVQNRVTDCPTPDATEFKSVSSQSFLIYNAQNTIHCFCPSVFDEYHFSLANMVIHTALLDYRFRIGNTLRQNSDVSLSSALFADVPKQEREKYCESLRSTYIRNLSESARRISTWYKVVCDRCLVDDQDDLFRDLDLDVTVPSNRANGVGISAVNLASCLLRDINCAAAQSFAAWQRLLHLLPYCNREHTALLRVEWEQKMIRRWGASMFSQRMTPKSIKVSSEKHNDAASIADACRASTWWRTDISRASLPVEDTAIIPNADLHPIIFEETYNSAAKDATLAPAPVFEVKDALDPTQIPSAPKSYRGSHLFVLVHGFQGNSFDMRLMKNNVAVLYPDAIFLCSNSNEENTEGSIQDMGIRLAQEVVNYICDWCPGPTLGRLSFIAHSIGGLIVRAALPLLHEYSSKLFTYISFSSAHLGYMYNASKLVNTGIWVLKKWRKSKCLAQLSMTDAENPKETLLFKLSMEQGLSWFENVVVVSSEQDQYSPFDSARVEVSQLTQSDVLAHVYRQMVDNIWSNVKPEAITRFNVNFRIPERNLDAMIGRTAHIQFLESQPVMRMIIHTYPHFFR